MFLVDKMTTVVSLCPVGNVKSLPTIIISLLNFTNIILIQPKTIARPLK